MKQAMPSTLPLTLGQDFAGEGAERGNSGKQFSIGDRGFGFAHKSSCAVVKPGGVLATTAQPVDEAAAKRAGIRAVFSSHAQEFGRSVGTGDFG
jgi:NADPH:quinone reductase-like Zn-dependent oxidoreductase